MEHFSVTALRTYEKCPEQWRRRYVMGERIPPGSALIRGRATHKGVSDDLEHKRQTGDLLPTEAVVESVIDDLAAMWKGDFQLTEDEKVDGLRNTKRRVAGEAERAARILHDKINPGLKPQLVETKFTLQLDNIPNVPIIGFVDLVETDLVISDFKVSGKKPAEGLARESQQLTLYSMAVKSGMNVASPKQRLITAATLKTKTDVYVQETVNDDHDHARVAHRMATAVAGINAGAFGPAPEGAWWCNAKWCGYHSTCPFVRGGKVVSIPRAIDVRATEERVRDVESD